MKKTAVIALGISATATAAFAGGVDRSGQSISPIFEEGSHLEVSVGHVSPSVSGGLSAAPQVTSGDMAESYTQLGGAFKSDINDKLSYALIWDQPFGADVSYPTGTGYPFAGATASISSNSITGVLRYKIHDRFSVHGGLRVLNTSGEVNDLPSNTPSPGSRYNLSTSTETDAGYLFGAAYEIPDIALRAAITYNSEITHDFETTENGTFISQMETTLPKSVNIDFQTGIAADTLLMASARWADWTSTALTPTAFAAGSGGNSLVSYDDDTISYTLGIGRRFSDTFSGSFTLGYEAGTGGFSSNLGPTDGYTSAQIGAKYQINEKSAVSGGIRYIWAGDTKTIIPTDLGPIEANFNGNNAVAIGLKFSQSF